MSVQNVCMEMATEMAGKMALGAQTRTQLLVYFWFTSRKCLNHNAGRWIPYFYTLLVFYLYFKDLLFFSQFTSGSASENLLGTSGNAHQREMQEYEVPVITLETFWYLLVFRIRLAISNHFPFFPTPALPKQLRGLLNESYEYVHMYMHR